MRRRRFGYSLCLGFMIFGLLAAAGDGSESTQGVDIIPSAVILDEDGLRLEKSLDESSSSNADVSGSGVISTQLPAVISRKQDNFALESFRDRPAARSLLTTLSPDVNAQLIAALDGKVQLVDINSGKVFWSFSSGPAIYSSYQAPPSNDSDVENALAMGEDHYVECGENWELLIRQKTGTTVFPGGIEKYFREMPHITYDGVTVGSKKTTVFVLDAMSGKLINTYQSSTLLNNEDKSIIEDLEESRPMKESDDVLPLYITRTDYLLQRFPPNSKKVLWNMTVAEIEAAIICRDLKNPSGDNLLTRAYVGNSESESNFVMPLPCHTKTMVVRPPLVSSMAESSASNKRLLKGPEKLMLPVDVPNHKLRPLPPVENVLDFDHERSILSLPASVNVPPLKPKHDKALDYFYNHNDNNIAISGQFSELKNPGVSGHDVLGMLSAITGVAFFVVLFIWKFFMGRKEAELEKQSASVDIKFGSAKKKRVRKSGKNNSTPEKRDKSTSPEFEDRSAAVSNENKQLLDLNKLAGAGVSGRKIGKLFISSKEIAKGSNGTIVLEGIYDGRPVAVKRLVQAHHDFAVKEIQNLIASDRHPNIVRWYGVEHDQDFVYLSLERCSCSLDDLIQVSQFSSQYGLLAQQLASQAAIEYTVRLDSMKGLIEDINLWKPNGYPSLLLLQLMRDVVSGLVHLHELGIVHRDLKPQNVLITKERYLCAKLSDMGISKRLRGDMSSLDLHATGCGSSGWQSPEQLNNGRQTRAVDLFSLGCVLFFCMTGGRHPFGDRLERDINIVKNKMDLFLVEQIPEAVDLLSQLLSPDPEMRPKAFAVLHHPLFWSSEMRLSFLRDASDRVELEDRVADSDILKALESKAPVALGSKWDEKMEPAFINNIGRYRRYKYDSVRDLLRVMRNKLNHYRELPQEIQELLGPVPEGFDGYFASRFPELLIEVYKVIHRYCGKEECFQKYFKGQIV